MHAISTPKINVKAQAKAEAAPKVSANPHRFADCMEAALTGIIFTGVLLFAAGLLHIVAPACMARLVAMDVLYGLAAMTGGFTILTVGHGLVGK